MPVVQAAPLYWDGTSTTADADGGAGTWLAAAGPANWDSAATAGSDVAWSDGSDAVFGGSGGAVSVSGGVSVASLAFGAPGYSLVGGTIALAGTPTIDVGGHAVSIFSDLSGSAPIVKTGSGTLTLVGSNTFSGLFTISSGTVKAGTSTALGAGTGSSNGTVVSSGATLDVNGQSLNNEYITISGTGVGGAGALVNGAATSSTNAVRYLTLAGPASVGGVGRWDLRTQGFQATLNMGGHVLTKTGPGDFYLYSVAVTNPGNIDVQSGRFWIEAQTSLPQPVKSLTVRTGASLAQSQNDLSTQNWNLLFENGTTWHSGYLASSWRGPVTLDGATAFDVGPVMSNQPTTQRINGRIGGAGSLTKTGPGALTLAALNFYTGGTTVNEGTLILNAGNTTSGAGAVNGAVTVNAGTLQLSTNGSLGSATGSRVTEIMLNGGLMTFTSTTDHSVPLLKIGAGTLRAGNASASSPTSPYYYTLRNDAVIEGLPSASGGSITGRLQLGSGNSGNTSLFNIAQGDAADDLRIDATMTEAAPGSGITKEGSGSLVLGAQSLYTGATVIEQGTLKLDGAATLTGSPILVEDGGSFATGIAGRTVASLTARAGGFLQLPAVAGGTTTVAGALVLESGSIGIRPLLGAGTGAGTYDLVTAGSITGSGIPVLDLAGSFGPTRATGSVAVNGNKLQLTITGTGASLRWNNATAGGAAAGTWDRSLVNFHDGVSNSSFQAFDSVTFDDTVAPGSEKTITLGAHVAPAFVTVDNSQGDYRLITAPGTLDGAGSLIKTGSGSLVISGANSYAMSGAIQAGGGIIDFSGKTITASGLTLNGGAFNNATAYVGPMDLRSGSSNAVLIGSSPWAKTTGDTVMLTANNRLSGQGAVTAGNLHVGNPTTPGTTGYLGTGQLAIGAGASVTFARSNNDNIISNAFSGSGSLNFVGSGSGGEFSFTSPNTGFSGPVTVTNALVEIGSAGGLGSGPISLVGSCGLKVKDGVVANPVSIANSSAYWGNGSGSLSFGHLVLWDAVLASPVTLAGNKNYTIRVTGDLNEPNSSIITGSIGETGGPAGISIYSGYGNYTRLTLAGANTYTGPTFIASSSMVTKLTGSLAGSAVTVGGFGSFGGNGVIGTGGSLTFGISSNLVADMSNNALTVNGDVNLGNSTKLRLEVIPSVVSGPIPVLKYTGTLTGGPANLEMADPSSHRQAIFAFTPGLITVNVGSKALVWRTGTTWESGGTTMRWGTTGSGTPTDFFYDGDSVRFDDTGSGGYIGGPGGSYAAEPSAMVVNNSVKEYFIGTDISGPCSVVKSGSATLKLSGTESDYTGGTVVNGGRLEAHSGGGPLGTVLGTGPVSIAAGATLAGEALIPGAVTIHGFVEPNRSTDSPLGTLMTGPTMLSGTYRCQLRLAGCDKLEVRGDLDLTGSSLTLERESTGLDVPASFVIASYTGNLTGSFGMVNGLPADYVLRYDSSAKQIRVERINLVDWAAGFPGLSDTSAAGDPDHDGVPNVMEYVLGGHPGQSSTAILPQCSIDSTYFRFHYKRIDASYYDTVQTVQWTTDLENWTNIPIGATNNGTVTITPNAGDPDDITVRIPRSQVNGSVYMRLKVEEK